MAAITDLTWQQVQDALGIAGAIALDTGKIVIDTSLVTGDTIDGMTDMGVLKFLNKLIEACVEAQTTVNDGQVAGERLNAFSAPSFGNPTNGAVVATRTIRFALQLDSTTQVVGTNV